MTPCFEQVQKLDVPVNQHWAASSALLHYMLGVSGQNAANAKLARTQGLDRDTLLNHLSKTWMALDPLAYPFVRGAANELPRHDDLADYLAGMDWMLDGMCSISPR